MYSSVLFDLDGTLLNTLDDLALAGNHTLAALGFAPHPRPAYKKMVGNGIPMLVQRMLPPGNQGEATHKVALSLFQSYYGQHMHDNTAPYPGISVLLQQLQACGVRMAVSSNKQDSFVKEIISAYFPGVFAAVLGHREDMPPKPHPAGALWLVAELGAVPTDTLYIGDSDVDMQTAHAAGVDACGVLWGFRDETELRGAGARYIAQTPEDLYPIITGDSSEFPILPAD